ncbi:hypothetical protein [Endozoicomonas sp. ONNA2]|uniref:hypothetical protein n=1 Tax=Endozoicomonas sp. ONNA2 TaxID=2828741 RepID=UPI002148B479|nr:hypothetical protein [Endozoicomonas sp. ONNA2]
MPVDSYIKPMTALEKSVLKDDSWLKEFIGTFCSRYVTDGLQRRALSIPPNARDPLLPPLKLLQLQQRHSVGRITYFGAKQELWTIDRVITSVLDDNSADLKFDLTPPKKVGLTTDSGESENLDATSVVVLNDIVCNEQEVKLLTSHALKEGSYLGFYHPFGATHSKTILNCREGQCTVLSPGKGLVLMYKTSDEGLPYWDKVAAYYHEERTVQMNPLLQETLDLNHENLSNGQYHLPIKAVQEISLLKRKSRTCLDIYRCCQTNNDVGSLKSLNKSITERVANGRGAAIFSIIVKNISASHMTAVRFIQDNNKIIVYLHETINPDCPLATDTRNFVIKGISGGLKNIRDSRLYFLTTPASGYLQSDYYSCSITALKVTQSFDKERNKLDQFFKQLVKDSESDKSLINYHELSAQGSGKAGSKGNSHQENIKVGTVPLTSLPAVLLKFYQGSQQLLSDHQKTTIVSHTQKLTLEDYFLKYRFLDPETKKTYNVAALCKTNKAFAMWKDMIRNFTPLFFRIFKVDFEKATKESVNRWLKNSTYSNIEISYNDLKMLKRYKNFVTMEADLKHWRDDEFLKWKCQCNELLLWLKEIRPNTTDLNTSQLMWRWCQFLNNCLDPGSEVQSLWARRDVGYVAERLEARLHLIEKNGRPELPFHCGEKFYREPVSLPPPEFNEKFNHSGNRCYIHTEVKESLKQPGRFNRIVMTFPKELLPDSDNEIACSESVSDKPEPMELELPFDVPGEEATDSPVVSRDDNLARSSTLDKQGLTAIHAFPTGRYLLALNVPDDSASGYVAGLPAVNTVFRPEGRKTLPATLFNNALKRERTAPESGFSGSSIKKQRIMADSIPFKVPAKLDMAVIADSILNKLEKDECKAAFEMLFMVLQNLWTLDIANKEKCKNKLMILKQAIQKVCEISKRTNDLENYLACNTVSGLLGLDETKKRTLTVAFALIYLCKVLAAAGELVNYEPLDIINAARIYIDRNTK